MKANTGKSAIDGGNHAGGGRTQGTGGRSACPDGGLRKIGAGRSHAIVFPAV